MTQHFMYKKFISKLQKVCHILQILIMTNVSQKDLTISPCLWPSNMKTGKIRGKSLTKFICYIQWNLFEQIYQNYNT